MLRVIQLAVACAVVVVCTAGQAPAGILYYVNDATDTLVSIDTDTLAVDSIGPLGGAVVDFRFGGLAYDPNADILYGVDGQPSTTFDGSLYRIDRNTGAATFIGTHGIRDLDGLAFDSSNNVLYGAQFSGGVTGADLYTLNTTTATPTSVGDLTIRIEDLAYDSAGDRLVGRAFSDLYEIDRTDGSQTLLLNVTQDVGGGGGFAFDPDENLFWGIGFNGSLVSYDPSNGFARTTHLSGLGGAPSGLAYVSSVPEPTSLALLATGACGFIGYTWRRKRKLPA